MENELKTLKDMGYFTEVVNFPNVFKKSREEAVFKWELKAEALKWIKRYGSTTSADEIFLRIWIKHFFNITDDEVKEWGNLVVCNIEKDEVKA